MDVRCSVIVVGYNNASDLPACLEGVLAQEAVSFEVILVDNASTDTTAAIAEQYRRQIQYLRMDKNGGYAAGNNAGVALATGEIFVFLNPDTVPQPGWLRALIRPLLEDSSLGITTSQILLSETPHLINTCGNDLTLTGLTVCRGLQQPATQWSQSGEVIAASGAACAIRRSLFTALGGFDETFFLYYEDTDLSLRTHIAGYKIWYAADSAVTHRYAFRFSTNKAFYQERNRWLALFKTLQLPTLLLLLPGLLLGELLAWVYAGLKGPAHLGAKLNGWLWLWRHRHLVLAKRRQTQAIRQVSDRRLLLLLSPHLRFTGTVPQRLARLLEAIFTPLLTGYGALCRRLMSYP